MNTGAGTHVEPAARSRSNSSSRLCATVVESRVDEAGTADMHRVSQRGQENCKPRHLPGAYTAAGRAITMSRHSLGLGGTIMRTLPSVHRYALAGPVIGLAASH